MSKYRCIATDDQAGLHDYQPGTRKDHDKLYFDGYTICGLSENHRLHRGACPNGCDRPAGKDGGSCCNRCDMGMAEHTGKCDNRTAKVTDDA